MGHVPLSFRTPQEGSVAVTTDAVLDQLRPSEPLTDAVLGPPVETLHQDPDRLKYFLFSERIF